MDDELLGLKGSLPNAQRKKLATMRGGSGAGKGYNPYHSDEDEGDVVAGHGRLPKSKDFGPIPFKRVDE